MISKTTFGSFLSHNLNDNRAFCEITVTIETYIYWNRGTLLTMTGMFESARVSALPLC